MKEMRKVDRNMFLANLNKGDIGLIHSHNFFATLQNLYRKKFNEGPDEASHGFYIIDPPKIAESNGMVMTGPGHGDPTILKFIGDKTECWVFRYAKIMAEQIDDMNMAATQAVAVGGHYGVSNIFQMGWRYLKKTFTGKVVKMKDGPGMFCTEFTSSLIKLAKIPYLIEPDYEITPSAQLNWFKTFGGDFSWFLASYYDGIGGYFIRS